MTKTTCILVIAAGLMAFLPASQGLAHPAVTVENPATNPAKTSSVDEPGRNPYQFTPAPVSCVNGVCKVTTPPVPAGKRLVVQHASAIGTASIPGAFVEASIRINGTTIASNFVVPILSNPAQPQLGLAWGVDQPVLVYADAGSTVTMTAAGPLNGTGVFFAIKGYLIDCTVNVCAPIAP